MTMTQLLEEAKREQKENIDMDERRMNERLDDMVLHLKKRKVKPSTIATHMQNIRAFYNHYYIQLPHINFSNKTSKSGGNLTLEQIKKQ